MLHGNSDTRESVSQTGGKPSSLQITRHTDGRRKTRTTTKPTHQRQSTPVETPRTWYPETHVKMSALPTPTTRPRRACPARKKQERGTQPPAAGRGGGNGTRRTRPKLPEAPTTQPGPSEPNGIRTPTPPREKLQAGGQCGQDASLQSTFAAGGGQCACSNNIHLQHKYDYGPRCNWEQHHFQGYCSGPQSEIYPKVGVICDMGRLTQ